MKLHKKYALDNLTPQTSQTDNFVSVCLLDFKEMFGKFIQETIAKKSKYRRFFFKHLLQQLQEKVERLAKPPMHSINDLNNERNEKETVHYFEKFATINDQIQPTGIYPEKQQVSAAPEITNNKTWTKLNIADFQFRYKYQHLSENALTGQSILCVGGRAALYPEYHRLIASLGAHLLIYRGSLKNNKDRLYTLLESADMIICPIDCINHSDFFAVKFYCRFSGKPYTLLDRSNMATFSKGVQTLSKLTYQHSYRPNKYN